MPRPKGEQKTRLNMEVTETLRARVMRLVRRLEADSMVEVIRRALVYYENAVNAGSVDPKDVPGVSIENQTALCVAAFLARVAEEKQDPVLAAAAVWVARGDWREVMKEPGT